MALRHLAVLALVSALALTSGAPSYSNTHEFSETFDFTLPEASSKRSLQTNTTIPTPPVDPTTGSELPDWSSFAVVDLTIDHNIRTVEAPAAFVVEEGEPEPVVFGSVMTSRGPHAGNVLVEMKAKEQDKPWKADIHIYEPSCYDGWHMHERAHVVFAKQGIYKLPDGRHMEIKTVKVTGGLDGQWHSVDFATGFEKPPAVVAYLQHSHHAYVRPRLDEITETGFKLALQGEGENLFDPTNPENELSGLPSENTIAYIAIEEGAHDTGKWRISSHKLFPMTHADKKVDAPNKPGSTSELLFDDSSVPAVMATASTYEGHNGVSTRRKDLKHDVFTLWLDEDGCRWSHNGKTFRRNNFRKHHEQEHVSVVVIQQGDKPPVITPIDETIPEPVGLFTFEEGVELIDQKGTFGELTLTGDAKVENGALSVGGRRQRPSGYAKSTKAGPNYEKKTMISIFKLRDFAARGGAVIGLEDRDVNGGGKNAYDSIAFWEGNWRPGHWWLTSSERWRRTMGPGSFREKETVLNTKVCMASTYDLVDGKAHIELFRDGKHIRGYNKGGTRPGDKSYVTFGTRHTRRGAINADILEAHIYDQVLTQEQIQHICSLELSEGGVPVDQSDEEQTVICETHPSHENQCGSETGGCDTPLTCPSGEVIAVNAAWYGRRNDVMCPMAGHVSDLTCHVDVKWYARAMCDGKSTCVLPMTNQIAGDPCQGTYKYGVVDYMCVEGEGVKPVGLFTFEEGEELVDVMGTFGELELGGNARVMNGFLRVSGTSQFAQGWAKSTQAGPNYEKKTLVSIFKLRDFNARAGSVIGLEDRDYSSWGAFDSITFWEGWYQPGKYWIAGSDFWRRSDGPTEFVETEGSIGQTICMAATYETINGETTVSLFRDGEMLQTFTKPDARRGEASYVNFGTRHSRSGAVNADIMEAHIYDQVLNQEQIDVVCGTASESQEPPFAVVSTPFDHVGRTVSIDASRFADAVLFGATMTTKGGDPGLVIASLAERAEGAPWTAHVSLLEPTCYDKWHTTETTEVVFAEPGLHTLSDGNTIEVGRISVPADGQWHTFEYEGDFGDDVPVVVAYIQHGPEPVYLHARISESNEYNFTIALESEGESLENPNVPFSGENVTVAYMALTPGHYEIGNYRISTEVIDTMTSAVHPYDTTAFDKAPAVVATVASYNGQNSGAVRTKKVNTDNIHLFFDKDGCEPRGNGRFSKGNRNHPEEETVNVFAIEGPVETAICEGDDKELVCPEGQEVHIDNAWYGRNDQVTCPSIASQMRKTNCKMDISRRVANTCNGKQSCEFTLNNGLAGRDPCGGTYKFGFVNWSCRGVATEAEIVTTPAPRAPVPPVQVAGLEVPREDILGGQEGDRVTIGESVKEMGRQLQDEGKKREFVRGIVDVLLEDSGSETVTVGVEDLPFHEDIQNEVQEVKVVAPGTPMNMDELTDSTTGFYCMTQSIGDSCLMNLGGGEVNLTQETEEEFLFSDGNRYREGESFEFRRGGTLVTCRVGSLSGFSRSSQTSADGVAWYILLAIILAGFALIIGFLLLAVWYYRRQQSKKEQPLSSPVLPWERSRTGSVASLERGMADQNSKSPVANPKSLSKSTADPLKKPANSAGKKLSKSSPVTAFGVADDDATIDRRPSEDLVSAITSVRRPAADDDDCIDISLADDVSPIQQKQPKATDSAHPSSQAVAMDQ
uniref:SUEL-type lectin domain-containing protein n=1 Tax=Chromera velia CCMP2878 TaxID=1169474 RepID=A0A0G4IDV2_9ALVE|eukprot:Cvel_13533.t1-p1 / transcript=Cvel_13533.t1 / gene=Cvel_13533 / organism=Chromera_velia_CCMP2878 / gene_product=L-rhamnose-binding lectin CSL3, putative / transcript_product=L-rhamnose-binding lectin CSL3, putative / location=Cvel_scaffold928:50648-59248(-) / protein_length=1690 / sequence_SO=supercontig / SO=protein_coding / is_pseudo=false